jgi:hypothetical protein
VPTKTYEVLGEVTVFDGSNVDELVELVGADEAPEPDENGAITLGVPHPPPAGVVELVIAPGDGLVHREPGFMLFGADQLAEYEVAS